MDLRAEFDDRGGLFADGVHPNAVGAELIAHKVFCKINPDNIADKMFPDNTL